jgi:hypothetical protein
VTAESKVEEGKTGNSESTVSDFIVPGGDVDDNEKKKKNKKIQKKMRLDDEEEEDEGEGEGEEKDEYDSDSDDDDDDDDDFDFTDGEGGDDEEENNKKFNLKAFNKQPTVLLSEGISVNLFLTKKENTDLNTVFDPENYGKEFLAERKAAAKIELEKLEKEIKELDEELEGEKSEGEKEVVVKGVIDGENEKDEKKRDELNKVENIKKIIEKDAATILKDEIKEIEKENLRRIEERNSILNFLLFSVLDGDMNINMKINGKKDESKTETESVIISVKQNKNINENNNENENDNVKESQIKKNYDVNQVQDVLNSKNTNTNLAVYKNNEKGKQKEVEKEDDLITLLLQAEVALKPSNNMIENSEINKIENETISETKLKMKMKNKKLNYFASPESVLGPSLIVAFEV